MRSELQHCAEFYENGQKFIEANDAIGLETGADMESIRSLYWRILVNITQVAVILSWCFVVTWRDKTWFVALSLLSALGALLMCVRCFPRICRSIQSRLGLGIRPSKKVQEERDRIASDLHDTLGSQLVQALTLMEAQQSTEGNPAKAVLEQSLLDLRLIVDSMDGQDESLAMRMARLRHRLEPVLQRKGLVLHWLLSDPELGVGRRTEHLLPRGRVAHQLLAVVQESISNAIEHAHATEVWVTLEPYEKNDPQRFDWDWYLHIEDNGKGFNLRSVLTDVSSSGHGVLNMFQRMKDIGGDLYIHPRQGGGTQVLARWRA